MPKRCVSSRVPPPRTTTSATRCSVKGGAPKRSTISGSALALKPDYALAHDALGVAVYTEGKVVEAIEHYLQAIAFDPRNADAHHHVAVALRSLGRLAEAIPHYRQVLQIDPDRQDIKTELADVERQLAVEPRCAADASCARDGLKTVPSRIGL